MSIEISALREIYLASLRSRIESRVSLAEIEARIVEAAGAGNTEARYQLPYSDEEMFARANDVGTVLPQSGVTETNLLARDIQDYFGALGLSCSWISPASVNAEGRSYVDSWLSWLGWAIKVIGSLYVA